MSSTLRGETCHVHASTNIVNIATPRLLKRCESTVQYALMSRAVYISGFAGGEKGAERVVSVLETRYNDVDSFTFSHAMANPDEIRKATKRVPTITHSAGMLALIESGANPDELIAFGPPLPMSLLQLPGRTIRKRMRMHEAGIGIQSTEDVAAIKEYEASSMGELTKHPLGNFGHIGKITRFDAVDAAIGAVQAGTETNLVYTHGDEYFQLSEERETVARAAGVGIMRLAGIHDELPLRPIATLDLFYGAAEEL
jgi:hypothetical protein